MTRSPKGCKNLGRPQVAINWRPACGDIWVRSFRPTMGRKLVATTDRQVFCMVHLSEFGVVAQGHAAKRPAQQLGRHAHASILVASLLPMPPLPCYNTHSLIVGVWVH